MWRMYRIFAEICKLRKDHLQLDVQDTCIQIHLNMRQRFLPKKFAELVEIMETSYFIRRGCPGASAVCLLDVCFMQTLFLFWFVGLLFWFCTVMLEFWLLLIFAFLLIRVRKGVCLSNIEYRPTLSLDSRTRLKLRELLKFNLEPALFQIHQQSCAI